jgi:hypothetical protein
MINLIKTVLNEDFLVTSTINIIFLRSKRNSLKNQNINFPHFIWRLCVKYSKRYTKSLKNMPTKINKNP